MRGPDSNTRSIALSSTKYSQCLTKVLDTLLCLEICLDSTSYGHFGTDNSVHSGAA